jgi:hypothetical protein
MELKCYHTLRTLSEILKASGDFYSSKEFVRSSWSLSKYTGAMQACEDLKKQTALDLAAFFEADFTLTAQAVIPFDIWSHGASYINFNFLCVQKGRHFDLKVKCMFFLNRIILSFDDHPDIPWNVFNENMRRKLKKFHENDKRRFIEFAELAHDYRRRTQTTKHGVRTSWLIRLMSVLRAMAAKSF